jgi:aldehyde dehydrogenase (NAD+)
MAVEARDVVVYDRLYIGGEWVEPLSGRMFDSYNPATGQVWARVAEAGPEDIDRAVKAAKAALSGPWSKLTPGQRGHLLHRLGDLIKENAERLAKIETTDNGKAIRETRGAELANIPEWYYYFAGLADKIEGRLITQSPSMFTYTLREPLGVVGAIIPWNSPLLMAAFKLPPALAAGNTVVLKPAEQTPVTALELAKLIDQAGFPPGVVNVVPGFGETAGVALTRHPGVSKIAFTGEHLTAIEITKNSAPTLKKLSFELGGKAPVLVFDDASVERAIAACAGGVFVAAGQSCAAASRIFAHRKVYDEFTTRFADKASKIRVGDPTDPATQMGAQTSIQQLEKIERYVALARQDGAHVAAGGRRPGDGDGYFFTPTVLAGLKPDSRVNQEEIFGPVTSVIQWEDEEEAIAWANDVKYGLTAGVFTTDLGRAHRVAARLQAGTVWVNCYRRFHWAVPYGGYKMSGYGRENGLEALDLYTQTKAVMIDIDPRFGDPFAK